MQFPEKFELRMREEFGDEYDAYKRSCEEEFVPSVRVNVSKISPDRFEASAPFPVRRIPWIGNGFYTDPDCEASRDPWYYAGLYYLQEASAMTPAAQLPIDRGDAVLDLCAAPGGKATELAAKLGGSGFLLANDISASRSRALLKNLELLGFGNIFVTSEDPEHLVACYPEFFDKILLDAPCSGEGMIRKDPSMLKSWMEKGPDYYAPIQKKLTEAAVSMLKPGGMLLYSTCTFSKAENEEVIASLLDAHPDLTLIPLPVSYGGFTPGDETYHAGMSRAIHIYPHKMEGAGHFTALLQKEGKGKIADAAKYEKREILIKKEIPAKTGKLKNCRRQGTDNQAVSLAMPKEAEAFLKTIRRNWSAGRFLTLNDQVYYLTPDMPEPKKLRYLRTGLWLGTIKNGRFTPSQALAMNLSAGEFPRTLPLLRGDERLIRYLRGETLEIPDYPDLSGDVLVLCDGYPLGFGRADHLKLKNKYYAGWRML